MGTLKPQSNGPLYSNTAIDSIADKIKSSGLGCYVKWTCMSVFLYADDIILLAPSVTSLQQLLLHWAGDVIEVIYYIHGPVEY